MADRLKAGDDIIGAPAEYALWEAGGSSVQVRYSLPVFHEIDFQVNEGYRRIPHGGVEIGGVLWGRTVDGVPSIEAFRQIECEHASGPSFNLSERDLAGISDLLAAARTDDELRSLEPLGWFIAHTRSPLVLTDREHELFQRFFPGSGKLTVLVKPERFQPTRFGFLVRGVEGTIPRDAGSSAVILPLPGRAGKGVLPSIPAPAEKSAAKQPPPPPVAAPLPAAPKPIEPVPALKPPQPVATPPPAAPPPPSETRRPEPPPSQLPPLPPRIRARPGNSGATFRLFMLLLLAAGLGCAVGYLAYRQLPPPVITLEAQRRGAKLFIQWPASQTQGVPYAAVRVDDGPPQLLTETEKQTGQLEVPRRTSVTKVEVIAQHWIRDSRGIIRFIAADAVSASKPAL